MKNLICNIHFTEHKFQNTLHIVVCNSKGLHEIITLLHISPPLRTRLSSILEHNYNKNIHSHIQGYPNRQFLYHAYAKTINGMKQQ